MTRMETVDRVALKEEELSCGSQKKKYTKQVKKSRLAMILAAIGAFFMAVIGAVWLAIPAAIGAAVGFFKMRHAKREEAVFTKPDSFYELIGAAILTALQEISEITSPDVKVSAGQAENTAGAGKGRAGSEETRYYACLQGGTEREKMVFADALAAFMGDIEDQRYLLEALEAEETDRRFYAVPEVFGKKKEDAGIFARYIAPCIGPCNLIFTRSEDGRRALLAAGIKEQKENRIERQKRVQSSRSV